MEHWVTIEKASQLLGVTERTIRRHIQEGRRPCQSENGKRMVRVHESEIDRTSSVDDMDVTGHDTDASGQRPVVSVQTHYETLLEEKEKRISTLEQEIADLLERLRVADESHTRSDTIILQLTQQLDRAHLQIEDLRHRPWWKRLFQRQANV